MNTTPDSTTPGRDPLTPTLVAGRERMLPSLLSELHATRRRRSRRRRLVGTAALVVTALGATLLARGVRAPGRSAPETASAPSAIPPAIPPAITDAPTPRFDRVTATAEDAVRWRPVATGAIQVRAISDEELLEELRATGVDCGLIRVGNSATLTCDLTGSAPELGPPISERNDLPPMHRAAS